MPPHYQQDLDQALIPAGAFAATEESAPTKGKRVPGKWQLLQVSYNAVYDETTVQ